MKIVTRVLEWLHLVSPKKECLQVIFEYRGRFYKTTPRVKGARGWCIPLNLMWASSFVIDLTNKVEVKNRRTGIRKGRSKKQDYLIDTLELFARELTPGELREMAVNSNRFDTQPYGTNK